LSIITILITYQHARSTLLLWVCSDDAVQIEYRRGTLVLHKHVVDLPPMIRLMVNEVHD
jgi:hypothetical protein